jgi:hypothetical protein
MQIVGKTLKSVIEDYYRIRLGGTHDTSAILGMLAAGLTSAPMGSSPLLGAGALALAASGGAYMMKRFTKKAVNRHLLKSNIDIPSDRSPHQPKAHASQFLLGYSTDTGEPIYIEESYAKRHLLNVGMTGAGKSVLGMSFMYQQIQRGGGLLFIDGKLDADNIKMLWQFACAAGRECDFRIINPGDPDNSNTYNPILFGDPDEISSRALALIPSSESSPGADFYRQEANQGITTLVSALQQADLAYNMIDLSVLLMNTVALEELQRRLAQSPRGAKSKERDNLALFLNKYRAPDPRTGKIGINIAKLRDTFGGIGGRLHMFGTGKFGQVMNTYDPEVRMFDAIMDRSIVYIALPTMGKTEAATNLGKMILGDLRTAISWIQALPVEYRPNPSFLIFMDELGGYATPALSRPFEQARSANCTLYGSIQSYANLEAVSKEFKQIVMDNTWTKIYSKLGGSDTATTAAENIGMDKKITRSLSDTESDSESASFLRATPESSKSSAKGLAIGEREVEDFAVSPDDLRKLDIGEVVITYGGGRLFNVRVPMVQINKVLEQDFGAVKLARQQPSQMLEGCDFSKDPSRFLIDAPRKPQE